MDTSVFQKNGRYLMLALDHRGSFKKNVNKKNPEATTDAEIIGVKSMIIGAVNEFMSGVLIDPTWGLPAYRKVFSSATPSSSPSWKEGEVVATPSAREGVGGAGAKPYLLCLEKTGYTEKQGERLNELQYTGAELKKWGASGAKLLIYSNPGDAETTKKQIATSKKALEEAHKNGLPLFLEFVTYGNEELGKSRSEWVLNSLKMYIEAGVVPDVWKLEYPASSAGRPGDLDSCKKITSMVGKTPWILLTRGESFDVFRAQLKDAAAAGAVGFLAGRALWQEIADYTDEKSRKKFLDKVVRKRFKEINKIVA